MKVSLLMKIMVFYYIMYLIEAFSEWDEAEMVGFKVLMNIIQGSVEGSDWRRDTTNNINSNSRHLISVTVMSRDINFLRRTAPTPTISSAAGSTVISLFSTSLTTRCCSSNSTTNSMIRIRPIALPWLCLIEYLRHHKFPFFLLLVLSQMVLVHHPVGLLWFPVLPKIGVQNQNLLAPLLFPIHHHRPCLTCLVPPGFPSLQVVTLVLNLPPLSCPCCVCL